MEESRTKSLAVVSAVALGGTAYAAYLLATGTRKSSSAGRNVDESADADGLRSSPSASAPTSASGSEERAQYTRALEAELSQLRERVETDYKPLLEENEELRATLAQYEVERTSLTLVPAKAVTFFTGATTFLLSCLIAFVVVNFKEGADSVFELPMLLPSLFVSAGICIFGAVQVLDRSGRIPMAAASNDNKSSAESSSSFTPDEVRAADLAAEALVGEGTGGSGGGGGGREESKDRDEQTGPGEGERGQGPGPASSTTSEHAALDRLYEAKAFLDLLSSLEREIEASGGLASAPVALLWRFCRVAGELEDMGGKGSEKLIFKALDATAVMLSREAGDREAAFHGNKWAGILLGQAGNYKSTADQVRDSRKIKEHITRALSYDSSDCACHYTLGRWHYAIADLPSSVRAGLSWIFSIPPASFQEAHESFAAARRSLGAQPWHSNTLWMAKSAIKCGGRKAGAARELLEEVVAAAEEGAEGLAAVGEETLKEAKALLQDMGTVGSR